MDTPEVVSGQNCFPFVKINFSLVCCFVTDTWIQKDCCFTTSSSTALFLSCGPIRKWTNCLNRTIPAWLLVYNLTRHFHNENDLSPIIVIVASNDAKNIIITLLIQMISLRRHVVPTTAHWAIQMGSTWIHLQQTSYNWIILFLSQKFQSVNFLKNFKIKKRIPLSKWNFLKSSNLLQLIPLRKKRFCCILFLFQKFSNKNIIMRFNTSSVHVCANEWVHVHFIRIQFVKKNFAE